MFTIALFAPIVFLIFEFSFNQILMPKRQFFWQIVFNIFYMAATYAFTNAGNVLFPNLVDASCNTQGCLWPDFFFFHVVFTGVTQACFWLLVFIHYAKVKFCCRKSVSIVYQPLFVGSQVSITAKQ